ncbi:hypothetical protein ACOSQ4_003116 [Xanthoceras sorbifolium]
MEKLVKLALKLVSVVVVVIMAAALTTAIETNRYDLEWNYPCPAIPDCCLQDTQSCPIKTSSTPRPRGREDMLSRLSRKGHLDDRGMIVSTTKARLSRQHMCHLVVTGFVSTRQGLVRPCISYLNETTFVSARSRLNKPVSL